MPASPNGPLTRRRLLGAAGAAAAVSVTGAATADAADSGSGIILGRQRAEHDGQAGAGDNALSSIPATNPAYEYYTFPGAAFVPNDSAVGRTVGSLGATVASATDMQAPVSLPIGCIVKEMAVWVTNTSGDPTYLDLGYFQHDVDTATYLYNLTVDILNGQTITNPLTAADTTVTLPGYNYFFNLLAKPGVHIKAVRIGVIPAYPSYRVVTPGRVYDSRPIFGGAGPLASGLSRTISVADRINPNSGTPVQLDFVPAGARAVSLNITAVNPVSTGYFVVNPGGDSTVGASSINWTTGENIANGIVCALNNARELTVVAGGSGASANFIIDITGYYL